MKYKDVIRSRSDRSNLPKRQALPLRPGCEDYKSIQSKTDQSHKTDKADSPKYTGDKIIGIATMHKSNAVPVTSQSDAIDIAKMRRS